MKSTQSSWKQKSNAAMAKEEKQVAKREHYLAVQEWQTAIQHFGSAMEKADVEYIASYTGNWPPLTYNMRWAMERYINACKRLRKYYGTV